MSSSLIRAETPARATVFAPSPEEELLHADQAGDAIQVDVSPVAKLNYSMLHNNRPLFRKFEVKRQKPGKLVNVRAEVVLNTGMDSVAYTTNFDLNRNQPVVDVNDRARVSLTSAMALSLAESVYTSLQVTVQWDLKVVYQETFRVALLPPDEWRDDDLNRAWLPSFVLPRDPIVAEIVDNSQKYLAALADDGAAGFDGYQGLVDARDISERSRSVDEQVQALWWCLIQDYGVGYINPPPSFTNMSQRLRTPTDITKGRRGTCIDLALLVSALVEYIDIYPVMFLLAGHAFPGYLRSPESYGELRKVFLKAPTSAAADASDGISAVQKQREWTIDQRYFSGSAQLVREGHIVPLETVALTQRSGFWEAVEQGVENLKNKADFQFLFDIKAAREADVTPIPLWSFNR